jgi:hypothetical protein
MYKPEHLALALLGRQGLVTNWETNFGRVGGVCVNWGSGIGGHHSLFPNTEDLPGVGWPMPLTLGSQDEALGSEPRG